MASQEQMQPIDMDEQFKMARRRPRWLIGRQTYPAPDAYSYTIALTAMRELNDAELEIDVGGSTAAGSGSTDVSRARKVARIVQAAESRGDRVTELLDKPDIRELNRTDHLRFHRGAIMV